MQKELEKNAERFTGFADVYDAARPALPAYPAEVITAYLGHAPERVVDLGCGTGLSTLVWEGRCGEVVGVEPSSDMLAQARKKATPTRRFVQAYAHETGLAGACADAVVCSQSFHWMEPQATLHEVGRILRPGGVFATVDCDWPPVCRWEAEQAYMAQVQAVRDIEAAYPEFGEKFHRWEKSGHLGQIKASGQFRYVREIVFANREMCDVERLYQLALSQGSLQSILKDRPALITDALNAFRQTLDSLYGDARFSIDFCYRMCIAVK